MDKQQIEAMLRRHQQEEIAIGMNLKALDTLQEQHCEELCNCGASYAEIQHVWYKLMGFKV